MIAAKTAKQNRHIRKLKESGATSVINAIRLEEYGIVKSIAFRRLVREKVIIQTNDKCYYVDVSKADELKERRQAIIVFLLIVISSAIVISLILIDYFSGDQFLMIEKW